MYKVAIWGAGQMGKMLYEYIINMGLSNIFHVVVFCDNDEKKYQTFIYDCRVIMPRELYEMTLDYIVIATIYFQEVKRQIGKEKPTFQKIIKDYNMFKQILYTKAEYVKKYGSNIENDEEIKNGVDGYGHSEKLIVIYTAITGEYDVLKDPECNSKNIKFICFTNNPRLKSEIWDIRNIDNKGLSDAMLARKIKLLPFEYMDVEGELIWADAKYRIVGDMRKYLKKYKKKQSMLLFPHFCRNNICDEMAELIRIKPELKRDVIIQTASYLLDGFKDNVGLYDTGCMVRDFSDSMIGRMMDEWWKEVRHYSIRDQLSLPYIFARNDYLPDICDLVIGENEYLKVEAHNK